MIMIRLICSVIGHDYFYDRLGLWRYKDLGIVGNRNVSTRLCNRCQRRWFWQGEWVEFDGRVKPVVSTEVAAEESK